MRVETRGKDYEMFRLFSLRTENREAIQHIHGNTENKLWFMLWADWTRGERSRNKKRRIRSK